MNRYKYIITLRQPDYKSADTVGLTMLLLALAMFGYTAGAQWQSRIYHNAAILYVVIGSFIVAWCVYCIVFAKKWKRVPYYRLALGAAAIGWFTEPLSNYWMGALYLLAALIERQVKFPMEIGADEEGITFNSFPAKSYAWNDINNMMLKENILTVDYKNNTIFQKEIETDVSPLLEKEFNAYCREKLHSATVTASPD